MEDHPFEGWSGLGCYEHGMIKNEEGRYEIAVGPKILNPEYPDDGRIWDDDFNEFSRKVNVVLEDINTGEEKVIECHVFDFKAHSYNSYPCNKGEKASFNVENGVVQTGIAYPESWNAKEGWPYAPDYMGASVIEFKGTMLTLLKRTIG